LGGIFGVCSNSGCVADLFFGTDYHSHLGPRRGGLATYDGEHFYRAIHNIENSPFRGKFEDDIPELIGNCGVGCISDTNPQPIIFNSKIGKFAVVTVGRINNKAVLAEQLIEKENVYFIELSGGMINDTELVASLICRKGTIPEGIQYAQSLIEGSMTMLVCAEGGIYAARDKLGRTPLAIGKKEGSQCASFEPFAYINLGYTDFYELGPGEVVFITENEIAKCVAPREEMKMCAFLWAYYGFPSSTYEGSNVEQMRYRNGESLARENLASGFGTDVDFVAGIPDSGTAHAIGYANSSGKPFARPLVKYTPTWTRSFTPKDQSMRDLIAKMKLVPINLLIENHKLLWIDDSIVRGTQMRGMVKYLYECGAKELHVRSACPPVLFNCKYLNFSSSNAESDLISRKSIMALEGSDDNEACLPYTQFGSEKYEAMVDFVRNRLGLTTLGYHSLGGMLDAIGISRCNLCTYCWNGEE